MTVHTFRSLDFEAFTQSSFSG